jgi:hypothetical protein
VPTCTVVSCSVVDLEGTIGLEMELAPYVDANGNGEVYLNLL